MERNTSNRKPRRIGRGRVLAACVGATVLGLIAAGCGGHEGDQASNSSGSGQTLVVAQASAPLEVGSGTVKAQPASDEAIAVTSADALPPDVAVTVADTLVYAGGSVEIKAQGSPDVVGVMLSDGIGRKQPFVYDAASDTWKVFYRVPIKGGTDRLALSATAKNASQRWRRVWLFLTVQHETPAAAPDSTEKP